jgi:hypothetical protein
MVSKRIDNERTTVANISALSVVLMNGNIPDSLRIDSKHAGSGTEDVSYIVFLCIASKCGSIRTTCAVKYVCVLVCNSTSEIFA